MITRLSKACGDAENAICHLAGVDLAWRPARNPSAVARGVLARGRLVVASVRPALPGLGGVLDALADRPALDGIAIDAPLIIRNQAGRRGCEEQLTAEYASRKAGCHPANATLYPDASSVALARVLRRRGFRHLRGSRWQIECYPHPALIEIFGLRERLSYKKGAADQKRAGQLRLAMLLKTLRDNPRLALEIPDGAGACLEARRIRALRGRALKDNEDALDSLVCLYIAGLYAIGAGGRLFGDTAQGYIWVPGAAGRNPVGVTGETARPGRRSAG